MALEVNPQAGPAKSGFLESSPAPLESARVTAPVLSTSIVPG
jgi:hypothetical protein